MYAYNYLFYSIVSIIMFLILSSKYKNSKLLIINFKNLSPAPCYGPLAVYISRPLLILKLPILCICTRIQRAD